MRSHPVITAATADKTSQCVSRDESSPVIRLKLDKPPHWQWELTTTSDKKLPVIQLLDKNGRLLVETTGRTAQRARGSIREGLRSHEEFPLGTVEENNNEANDYFGNRNFEGYSTKFGCSTRKSRSEASLGTISGCIKNKRNSTLDVKGRKLDGEMISDVRVEDEDETSAVINRCRKVREYLRHQRISCDSSKAIIDQVAMRKRYSAECSKPASVNQNCRMFRTRKVRSDTNIKSGDWSKRARKRVTSKGNNNNATPDEAEGSSSPVQDTLQRNDSLTLARRRKIYRKSKSDAPLGNNDDDAGGGESNGEFYPPRRIKSQDSVERSWREYKERKRQEKKLQQQRECNDEWCLVEEDFMAKPRWKDLQANFCTARNCRVCENMRDCEGCTAEEISDRSRPATRMQENYLMVNNRSYDESNNVISKVQVNGDTGDLKNNNNSCCDNGYNSISKDGSCHVPNVNSNVKKSDTFCIIDGSEDLDEVYDSFEREYMNMRNKEQQQQHASGDGDDQTSESNEDAARDYFRRVYELLKQRRAAAGVSSGDPIRGDTSSLSYYSNARQLRDKRRRRKKDKRQGNEYNISLAAALRRVYDATQKRYVLSVVCVCASQHISLH